ncbi:MAG TPA: uroporphyrinogen-III synthase, partial [Tichowtungia sp.]|nr:uroporphyrinogen-III synthase [Tichowtungia sp.]
DIVSKLPETKAPGLVLIGDTAAEKYLYQTHGALRGKRVWLTCSAAIQERAAQAVLDFGGVPVQQPLIELVPVLPTPPFGHPSEEGISYPTHNRTEFPSIGGVPEGRGGFSLHGLEDGSFNSNNFFTSFDWLIVTSPSAVRCLMTQVDDLRALPKILCCGKGTARTLADFKIRADAMPDGEYNSAGVLAAAKQHIPKDARILRVRSDRAGEALSNELRRHFDQVDDQVICTNRIVKADVPPCDVVFFASVSAVESFMEQFGVEALDGKSAAVIGTLDAAALQDRGIEQISAPKRSTVEGAMDALALACVKKELS